MGAAELHACIAVGQPVKLFRTHQGHDRLFHLFLLFLRHLQALQLADPADRIPDQRPVTHPQRRRRGQQRQHGHLLSDLRHTVHIGQEHGLRHLLHRELGLNIECAYALDIVAGEVETVRVFGGIGKDVDDPPTQGILARTRDEVDRPEAFGQQLLLQQ